MSSQILQITDKQEHDEAVEQSKQTPTVIYVSNSNLPICKSFTPKYYELAQRHEQSGVRFCQMEFQTKTSMLFKFSPNQLPVTVLMVHDAWCRTVMGDDMAGLEAALGELMLNVKK
jgi:thioredoxin-like negative regulator of GroEL